MKKEFVVERDGKSFVLYAGLLAEAHEQGLKAIRTTLLQIPTEENGYMAVCHATVETEKGIFSGLGDAAPGNVTRPMVNHLIRMAETRAKARALRDAVNVGVTALEELGDEEEDEVLPTPGRGRSIAEARQTTSFVERTAPTGEEQRATAAQVRAIYAIARNQLGFAEQQTDEKSVEQYGHPPAELTKRQASEFITTLQTANNGHQ